MIAVTISSNAIEVVAKFARMAAGIENPAPLLLSVGEHLVESTKQRYVTSTAPDGTAWAALAPSTLEQYVAGFNSRFRKSKNGVIARGNTTASLRPSGAAKLAGRRILVSGGTPALGESYTRSVEGRALVIGTNVSYAAVHQFGGKSAYVIRPKNKKALAWAGGAHPVKSVNHPPLKARPALGISDADGDMMLMQTAAYISNFAKS